MKKLFPLFLVAAFFSGNAVYAQLYISSGSTFMIQSGGVVTVQGDVQSSSDITGAGKLLLKGSTVQNVNMNGFIIPNLEMDNTANATLTGNAKIGSSLLFTNGKISAGNFDLRLADIAAATGGGAGKFVETNGTGQLIKELTGNASSFALPLGAGSVYRPAFLTTSGTYSAANVGVKLTAAIDPNRPPSTSDYIAAYWPVTRTGVTGSVTLTGQYDDADISGTESFLNGYYRNGIEWNSTGNTANNGSNQISAPITAATGELTAIDKFDLVNPKALLQGAYNSGGIMNDNLRTSPSVIPNSDPYRVAPYAGGTGFTHVNNPISENAPAAVFADFANNNNIVDWVFLELRDNNASPNTVLQTRSALIQKDGDIVDVDGISPVTFNRIADGSYTLVVRHRNHLGISTDPSAFQHTFSERSSVTQPVDFTAATDAQLFGTASAFTISGDGKTMLWGGNANFNTTARFTGLNNDKDYLLVTVLNSVPSAFISNTYNAADMNMNRTVRFTGLNNDKDFLLINVLGSVPSVFRAQALPF